MRNISTFMLAFGLSLAASARYVPADWEDLPILTGGGATTLPAGDYRVMSAISYSDQLSIADNATVTLWFTNSATLTTDLSSATSGKAAIKLPSTSTLIFRSADGTGSVVAKGAAGSNAADGNPGRQGKSCDYAPGGDGGAGASGGGAGIGGDGGAGGAKGAGGGSWSGNHETGKAGDSGTIGSSGGRIFVFDGVTVSATAGAGGAAGDHGSGGDSGSGYSGGGGGGGGGEGGAGAAIGGGGGGGGGGAGGGGAGEGGGGGGGGGGRSGGCGYGGTGSGLWGNGSQGGDGDDDSLSGGSAGGGSYNAGGGNSGGAGASGGAGGTLAYYEKAQINSGKAITQSDTLGGGAVATIGRKVTLDWGGVAVQSGCDTYTLAIAEQVAPTPIVPPVAEGLERGAFAGYFTAATGGACIFNSDGSPTGNALESTSVNKLYAHWAQLYVNGEPAFNERGKGWYVENNCLYLTDAMEYRVSGKNSLADFSVCVTAAGATLTLDNLTLANTSTTPVDINASGTVTLRLTGASELVTAASARAGVRVSPSSTLIIERGGTLVATGGDDASDIGANGGEESGSVIIVGGNVMATHHRISPAPTNAAGEAVYEVKVPASGASSLLEPVSFIYGTDDIAVIDGYLHLWLPNGEHTMFVDGHPYVATVAFGEVAVVPPTAVTVGSELQLRESLQDGVSVTLGQDITMDDGVQCQFKAACKNKGLYFDLAGHTLTYATNCNLFVIRKEATGLTLTVRDSSAAKTGRIRYTGPVHNSHGGLFYLDYGVASSVRVVLESGTVSGFHMQGNGGAVKICENGTFEMRGGVIENCVAEGQGGAVYLERQGGSFIFTGGVISNCTTAAAGSGGAVAMSAGKFAMSADALIAACGGNEHGGGLYLTGGAATIEGGMITNCAARLGGAVALYGGGSVTMNGGAIVGNRVPAGDSGEGHGGAVFADVKTGDATTAFTFNGGRMANNAAMSEESRTGGVAMWRRSTFTMNGGVIVGCEGDVSGRVIYVNETATARACLKAGIFDDDTIASHSNATFPAGYSLAGFDGTYGKRYVIASNAVLNVDGAFTSGTFKFDPGSAEYIASGLRIASGYAAAASEDEWTILPITFTINGVDVGEGGGDGWSYDALGVHLTTANKTYTLAGISPATAIYAEAEGQIITLNGVSNANQRAAAYCVAAGVSTNTLLLRGLNSLVTSSAGEPAVSVAAGTTLVIDAADAATAGVLLAKGGAGGAGIGGAANAAAGTIRILGGAVRAVSGEGAAALGAGAAGTAEAVRILGGSVSPVGGTSPAASNDLVAVHSICVPVLPTGAVISFDEQDFEYALSGVIPLNEKIYVWQPRGKRTFTIGGDAYEAEVVEDDLNAQLIAAGLASNGSFEFGEQMPLPNASAFATDVKLVDAAWGTNVVVFGRASEFARDHGFSVAQASYGVALGHESAVGLLMAADKAGLQICSVNVQGPVGATVWFYVNDKLSGTVEIDWAQTATARFYVTLEAGQNKLEIVNNSADPSAYVAIDDVRVVSSGDEAADTGIQNGSFESGTGFPAVNGSVLVTADGATLDSWAAGGTGATYVYGYAATDYPQGVTEGEYALALDSLAQVSQGILAGSTDETVVDGVTGNWYRVEFDFASWRANEEPRARVTRRTINGTGEEVELAVVAAKANGAWSSVSTLAFFPAGSNLVTIANASMEGRLLVDNFVCRLATVTEGECLQNGSFEYGTNLPDETGRDATASAGGAAEPCAWAFTGQTGIFGKLATDETHAGTHSGTYAVSLENGATASQSFLVKAAGEYRIAFAYAARHAASEGRRPVVTVTIDGETKTTLRALSDASYSMGIALVELEEGTHTLAFSVETVADQALFLDTVSVMLRDPDAIPEDITGITPAIRLRPYPAGLKFIVAGATAASTDGLEENLTEEDFATDGTNDFYRVEPFAGAYAHPAYVPETTLRCENGMAISLGGVVHDHDGPLVSYVIRSELTGARFLNALVSEEGGRSIALKAATIGDDGEIGEAATLFTYSTENIARQGSIANFVVNGYNGTFGFYANGNPVGEVTFTRLSPLTFESFRIGEFPDTYGTNDLSVRAAAKFDFSDFRVYPQGLTAEQIADLAAAVKGDIVNVTLFDPATSTTYGVDPRNVGGVYGPYAGIAPLRPGYQFLGWSVDEQSDEYVTSTSVVRTPRDHRLCANWSNLVYEVTYDFNGYPFADTNIVCGMVDGEAYSLPVGFEVAGATFRGWTNSTGKVLSPGAVFPVDGLYHNETFYADFDAVFGRLAFEPHNGGKAEVYDAVEVGKYVAEYAPADPSLNGYTFQGWFTSETGGAKLTDETRFSNYRGETWHAQWLGNLQTNVWRAVGCLPETQKTVSRTGDAYILPEMIPTPTNSAMDVKFYGWGVVTNEATKAAAVIARWDYETDDWVIDTNALTPAKGQNLVALWWTACTFDAGEGEPSLEKTYLFAGLRYDAWATLPKAIMAGFDFQGWHMDSTEGPLVTGETIVTNPTPTALCAAWAPATVHVTLDANGGENQVGSVEVTYLEPYGEIPAPTRPGYALSAWRYIVETGSPVYPNTIVETYVDHTLVASWTNAWYEVGYKINGVSVGPTFSQRYENPWPALYVPTTEDLKKAGCGEHAIFEGWLLDYELVQEGDTALITEKTTLIAAISGEPCTLEFNVNGGFLDPDERTWVVEYGEYVWVEELPQPSRDGWSFGGWYNVDGTKLKDGEWLCSGTTELIAKWIGDTPRTMTYYDNSSLTPSAQTTTDVHYCDTMKFPSTIPTREDGATFLGWWQGGVQVTDAQGKPLDGYANCWADEDMTFVARWSMPRDAFANAYALTSGVKNTVVGVVATDEEGEPDHDDYGELRATHWYSFNATKGTSVTITFEDFSAADWPCAALAVYTGTSLEDLEWIDGVYEIESFTATLTFKPEVTGKYYLAVAQSKDDASALSAYSIVATGIDGWQSAWTDPDTMPGATKAEQNENALLNDGFDEERARRLSPTNTYKAFASWACIGNPETEVPPEQINDKANAILAAAYDLTVKPNGTVAVTECVSTNVEDATSLILTVQVSGDFTAGGAYDADLLAAALGVVGSAELTGTYSVDVFDYTTLATDKAANKVTILVTPKKVEDDPPDQFFFQPASY